MTEREQETTENETVSIKIEAHSKKCLDNIICILEHAEYKAIKRKKIKNKKWEVTFKCTQKHAQAIREACY